MPPSPPPSVDTDTIRKWTFSSPKLRFTPFENQNQGDGSGWVWGGDLLCGIESALNILGRLKTAVTQAEAASPASPIQTLTEFTIEVVIWVRKPAQT